MQTVVRESFMKRYCPNPAGMYDLGELHAEFNAKYFNGEIPPLRKTVRVDENGEEWESYPKQLAWNKRFTRTWGRYSHNGVPGRGFIEISYKIATDPDKVRGTLIHEMVHQYVDLTNGFDGIEGHGENFIRVAVEVNKKLKEEGRTFRVEFNNTPEEGVGEITKLDPHFHSELIGVPLSARKDLDIARKMRAAIRMAFDSNYTYVQ
ncbi:putative transcription elongation protein [Synechococcus phage S-CBWM1]|uniref:Putative transcription elongation protein n=1 Tax=Synechococcus phage S-CBWM1 TaxID=2053653 RepID=A0A3G1L3G9_9CAUD|nr:putative transcription elongation protein [Synechococcus phage S-CBWM1]ATW62690.1 putative transcription elongation protein [Synechococcus phage S-CBWM1]